MREVSQAIADFVTENRLTITEEGICFDAVLFIYTRYLCAQVENEVHIMSIGKGSIDTVQLLNPSLGIDFFPTVFEAGYVDISFQTKKGLLIRGNLQSQGPHKLVIHPIANDCRDVTSHEIKARYYN